MNTSFPKVADQILNFNKNVMDILTKINTVTSTNEAFVNLQLSDENGVLRNFTLPSITSIKSDIERLNNNINAIYNIDSGGSLIESSNSNKFRKIITVSLNKEPNDIGTIGSIDTFKSKPNWFFENMLNPLIYIDIDLSGKVDNFVGKCLSRRYIVGFEKDESGNFSALGTSALNSFNELFRGDSSTNIEDFENWHRTTPGVLQSNNPNIDEEMFDLEPNTLQYDGLFSVLKIEEDRLNRKLWYYLNTLNYLEVETGDLRKLNTNDMVTINVTGTSTRYKIIEVSTDESLSKVRFERVDGLEPIPVGTEVLKIYSNVLYKKRIRVGVGYDERNVIFLKPLNTENNIISRNWSTGTGFYTNDLRLSSDSSENGLSMDEFYSNYAYDYGRVIKDISNKTIPTTLAGTPISPSLDVNNFKVTQINKHLTDTTDSELIKEKHNTQLSLKSEIQQLSDAIKDKNKRAKVVKFKSESSRKQYNLEIEDLTRKKESKTKLISSVTQEILDLSKNPNNNVEPKFRLRGFWNVPDPILTTGTEPQQIIQFKVKYRYLSKDGRENSVETFETEDTKASFTNWVETVTKSRERKYDKKTDTYIWVEEDLLNPDVSNSNQLDISIQANERVEIRIKSISEVGWPTSSVESNWSDPLFVDFPDDLNSVINENSFILQEATKSDLKVSMETELESRGLTEHLADTTTLNNKTFHHESNKILSGFKDDNGVALDLFEYLRNLEDKIKGLEEKIKRAKGELEVVILRNNQEFIIKNNSTTTFNVECEDYLDNYTSTGVPSGRVYQNNIYVVKDFVVRVNNVAIESPLGLLSNRTYLQNPDVYKDDIPQTFWVNNQDELITSDISSTTRSQLNNQFVWSVNYDSVSNTSLGKLGENIGNSFGGTVNNSITSVLGSNEFNVGYSENSILNFNSNNKSLLETTKWVDNNVSISSTTKLLTSIHPVVGSLEELVETNSDKIKSIDPGENSSITIPINIYFKVNALDFNQTGLNYEYINFNNSKETVKHVKKLKFFLENESENRPFEFTMKFNINRNKVVVKKTTQAINQSVR